MESILTGKGCTDLKKTKCKGRSGPYLQVLCDNCDEKEFDPHPYALTVYNAALLMDAGFPVTADTYCMDFWLDLGLARIMMRRHHSACPMF